MTLAVPFLGLLAGVVAAALLVRWAARHAERCLDVEADLTTDPQPLPRSRA